MHTLKLYDTLSVITSALRVTHLKFSPSQIKRGKAIVASIWILAIAAFLLPEYLPFSKVLVGIGIVLIVAHLAEIIIFNKRLKSLGNYLGVLLFGILHIQHLSLTHQREQEKL